MLTTSEAARYLGISLYYLRNMRHLMHNHDGPEYIKKACPTGGEAAYYSVESLEKWKKNHKWKK